MRPQLYGVALTETIHGGRQRVGSEWALRAVARVALLGAYGFVECSKRYWQVGMCSTEPDKAST